MSKLPLLEKNAYLSILIKDNGIWCHLAYTDHNANREYILSDFTDLNPLRHRLDDDVFEKSFWLEYFDSLEKIFNWDIVDRNKFSLFTFRKFKNEGDGLTGIRIQIDDNQKFFDKIFSSIREFSRDISLRVVDDLYVQSMLEGLIQKSEYEDILYVDMDLLDYSIFRAKKVYDPKTKLESVSFSRSKISWNDDRSVVDTVKDSRFKAFLASDLSERDILNYWSNFVLNRVFYSEDPNLIDILRSYSTIQNHSLYRDNSSKLENFGINLGKSAVIVSGYVPRILGKSKTLLTLIDGLELGGSFDCYWDLEMRLLSYGRSYINGINSTDIILTRKDIFSESTYVVIPYIKNMKNSSRVIFSGSIQSISIPKSEFFVLSPEYTYISIPSHEDKCIVEGEFKNGAYMLHSKDVSLGFVSTPGGKKYDSLLIDARPRPIVYGPDSYTNKLKLQKWFNDSKA